MIAKTAYEAELDATQEIVALEREQLKLAQVKANAGTAPYSNVLSIESQLDSFEATIPGARAEDHAVGRSPRHARRPDARGVAGA